MIADLGQPDSTVRWTSTADGVRVVLQGEIDLSCRDALDQAIAAITDAMPGTVRVDVTAVTFFASEGLGFLGRAANIVVQQHHRQLTLHNPDHRVMRSLEIFGMQDQLTITHD